MNKRRCTSRQNHWKQHRHHQQRSRRRRSSSSRSSSPTTTTTTTSSSSSRRPPLPHLWSACRAMRSALFSSLSISLVVGGVGSGGGAGEGRGLGEGGPRGRVGSGAVGREWWSQWETAPAPIPTPHCWHSLEVGLHVSVVQPIDVGKLGGVVAAGGERDGWRGGGGWGLDLGKRGGVVAEGGKDRGGGGGVVLDGRWGGGGSCRTGWAGPQPAWV